MKNIGLENKIDGIRLQFNLPGTDMLNCMISLAVV
jgi:hypothetical protein